MKKIIAFGLLFIPAIAFAIQNTNQLTDWLVGAFNMASVLIVSAAVIVFLWGVFKYVRSAGEEKAQETGKKFIINGIIGIAVMVSVWGLVNFLTNSANLDTRPQYAPQIPYQQ